MPEHPSRSEQCTLNIHSRVSATGRNCEPNRSPWPVSAVDSMVRANTQWVAAHSQIDLAKTRRVGPIRCINPPHPYN